MHRLRKSLERMAVLFLLAVAAQKESNYRTRLFAGVTELLGSLREAASNPKEV